MNEKPLPPKDNAGAGPDPYREHSANEPEREQTNEVRPDPATPSPRREGVVSNPDPEPRP